MKQSSAYNRMRDEKNWEECCVNNNGYMFKATYEQHTLFATPQEPMFNTIDYIIRQEKNGSALFSARSSFCLIFNISIIIVNFIK